MSADVIARLTAIAEGEEDAGYGFDPLSQVIVNVTDLRALCTAYAQVTAERDAQVDTTLAADFESRGVPPYTPTEEQPTRIGGTEA